MNPESPILESFRAFGFWGSVRWQISSFLQALRGRAAKPAGRGAGRRGQRAQDWQRSSRCRAKQGQGQSKQGQGRGLSPLETAPDVGARPGCGEGLAPWVGLCHRGQG